MRKPSRFLLALTLVTAAVACQRGAPSIVCDTNLNLSVNLSLGKLPDTCASKSANPVLTWRSSDNSKLSVQIPDWNGTPPTTGVNPYPTPDCNGTTTYCASGSFQGGAIPNDTPVMYSLTMTNATASKKIYGRIIIKP